MRTVQRTVRLDGDRMERLEELARNQGIRISELMRLVLEGAAEFSEKPAVIACGRCNRVFIAEQEPFRLCPYCGHRLGDDPSFRIRSPW